MGNNAAFTCFEKTVVSLYKRGKLDKSLLADVMEQYRDMDIDSGGKAGLFVKEGKRLMEVEDIVIKVMTGKILSPPNLPKDHRSWTPEQYASNEDYQESRGDAFHKITDKFGWS